MDKYLLRVSQKYLNNLGRRYSSVFIVDVEQDFARRDSGFSGKNKGPRIDLRGTYYVRQKLSNILKICFYFLQVPLGITRLEFELSRLHEMQ